MQIAEEMKRYGYLGPYELQILERISLIEVFGIYTFIFAVYLLQPSMVLYI